MKILITTSSFGIYDEWPLESLKSRGYEVLLNPHGRKLAKDELVELASGCTGIVAGTEKYDEEVFSKLPELKVISRCGVGMDSIDLEAAKKHGVKIINTPDAPTQAVAELALCLILCSLRRVSMMDRKIRQGVWKKEMGNLLSGKTVGIVGLGRIGRRLAELLQPFRLTIIAAEPNPDVSWAKKNDVGLVSLEDLLGKSDVVSLHVPYSSNTHHLINFERIKLMKKGAFLLNTSRGGIVDEKALYEAVKEGRLNGAALDVMEKEPYDGELKGSDDIVLTPHIGSYAKEARINMETAAVENLMKMLEEEK